jgi:hypothetical protein
MTPHFRTSAIVLTAVSALVLAFPIAVSASVVIDHSSATSLSSGLVGYWNFDGPTLNWSTNTVADVSGNNNTGQLIGMSTTSSPVAGKIGGALKFNGSASYVAANATASQFSPTGNYSIALYFKTTSLISPIALFAVGSTVSQIPVILLQLNNQALSFFVRDNAGNNVLVQSSSTYNDGKWHFAVAIKSGNSFQTYMDGVSLGSGSGIIGASALNSAVIGAWNSTSITQFFPGTLDDVRIYNRALSAQEVGQLYAQGLANVAHSNTVTLSSGLVGYWTLDGSKTNWATGKTQDSSGNNNTGQLIGMSTTSSPVAGKIGQALKFDGATNYVNAGSGASLNITGPISSCVLAKSSTASLTGEFLGNRGGGGYRFGVSSGNLLFTYFGVTDWLNGGSFNSDNHWHQYCVVNSNSGSVLFYVDGKQTGAIASAASGNSSNQPLYFGARNNIGSPTSFFPGSLDDVRIYNRTLSAQEVGQLYAQGSATIAHSNTVPLSSGLVGYWTFDGGTISGTTARDSSGQGNNGTLVSGPVPVAGKIGQALRFDGTSQKITYGTNVASFKFGTGSFSISAWVRPVNKTGQVPAIFGVPSGNGTVSRYGLTLDYITTPGSTGVRAFMQADSNHIISVTSSQTLPNNKWAHLVMVVDRVGQVVTAYVNGIPTSGSIAGSFNLSDVVSPGGTAVTGAQVNGSNDFVLGSIDDVRIYNRALSAQEVQQLYFMER